MGLFLNNIGLESFAQTLTLLIIFVFVLTLTYLSTKWVGNYQKNKQMGSNVKILETMKISNTKYIQIVKIGSKCFAIAVCKDTVTYLCEVSEDELVFTEHNTHVSSDNFKMILDKFKKEKQQD